MMESTSILVNKLCLRIARGNDQSEDLGVGDIVLGMMYKQISQIFNILFDWRTFSRGGTFITADNRVKGNIQTAHTSDDHMLWAARLSVKDDSYQRRRWVYNMSIVQISDEEISFYYAKCYQDHLAGSLKIPRERPKTKDMLPEILFDSPQINCMIGRYAYPRAPIVLDDYSLNDVVDLIMDLDRPIPIMLITCPDVVSPETIFDMTKGNLIVACCDDTRLVMDLNAGLPKNLYTQWDSIHILMPLSDSRAYHPTYTYSDIRSMGIDTFMDGIRQAFCESMRSKEKYAFFTVEDVEKCRNRGQANQLAQTCKAQKDKMREMEERLAKQDKQIEGLLSQLQEVSSRSKEITEYEEMIDESMAECGDLKRGISDLTTQLYASMGGTFHPNEQEHLAILQELSHAIFVAMACVAEKR